MFAVLKANGTQAIFGGYCTPSLRWLAIGASFFRGFQGWFADETHFPQAVGMKEDLGCPSLRRSEEPPPDLTAIGLDL